MKEANRKGKEESFSEVLASFWVLVLVV